MGVHSEFIVSCLREFTEQAPDVNLKISTMVAEEVITAVLEGQVDIGITVYNQTKHPRLQTLYLYDEALCLYCGVGHPLFTQDDEQITIEEMGRHKYITSTRFLPGKELHPFMQEWDSGTHAMHQEARAQLILTGKYLGFLLIELVKTWGWNEQLRPLKPDLFSYHCSYYAFAKASALKGLSVETFFDVLGLWKTHT